MDPVKKWEFRSVLIVGLGLIGGSLALALRRFGFTGTILGISRAKTLDSALQQNAIDQGYPYEELPAVASRADLIVLASPIHSILEHLRELGKRGECLQDGTLVTDVGSTKRVILEEAAKFLPERVHFVGGHPMAGSEKRGFSAAEPFLFQNAYYVLTPGKHVPQDVVSRLGGTFTRIGARVVVLTAEEHDRIAAAISHLPQLLAVALVNFLGKVDPHDEHAVHLAAGGFRDMTRIASSSFEIWRDIFQTNSQEIRKTLKLFMSSLEEKALKIGDRELERVFDKAAKTRAKIPRDTKGFLNPLWEILVVAEDRPGVIASIASTLTKNEINIKDIEVLKVREGEGGTLRLAFSGLDIAQKAIQLLAAEGFLVRLRE